MPLVARRPRVESDLEKIWLRGVDEFGLAAAETALSSIDRTFSLLSQFRELGPLRPDIGTDLRVFPVRRHPFLIFYRTIPDGIEVIRVLYSRRDLRADPLSK